MKLILINIILLVGLQSNSSPLFETHFIGMHKTEIAKTIAEKHRVFKRNTTTINNSYNYLKYEDHINEITVLFFLTDEDKCKAIRIMSDYSNINDIISQLDDCYKKVDKKTWTYKENKTQYNVTLEEGDWFFTVSVKEKE